jgi:hypothetical protein
MTESGDVEKTAPTRDDPLAALADAVEETRDGATLKELAAAATELPPPQPPLADMEVFYMPGERQNRAMLLGARRGRLVVRHGAIALTPMRESFGSGRTLILTVLVGAMFSAFVSRRGGAQAGVRPLMLAPSCVRVYADSRRRQMSLALPDGKYLVLKPATMFRKAAFEKLLAATRTAMGDNLQEGRLAGPGFLSYARAIIFLLVFVGLVVTALVFAYLHSQPPRLRH